MVRFVTSRGFWAVLTAVLIGSFGARGDMQAAAPTPYKGTPFALPGTVAAADFDNGGQGISFYDTSSGNSGGLYRQTHVDLQRASIGGYNVGWTAPGEWLKYTVKVGAAGSYNVTLRAAAISSSVVHLYIGSASKAVSVPNTGGWQTYKTFTVPMTLAAGQQMMTLKIASGEVNLHSVNVASASSATSSTTTATTSLSPYRGTPFVLPGTVPAAEFDNGGRNIAYSDTSSGNSGSVFRSTDVDLQGSSLGGYNVGWVVPGEWLKYTVNVKTAGTYNVSLRVGSLAAASVQVYVGSAAKAFSVPNTGGWQAWRTVTVPMTLAAGQQVMTVKFATGSVNLHSIIAAAATSSPTTSPTTPTGSGSLRVLTWNVQHGRTGKYGAYDPVSQARFIAAQNPHVVLLQEVQTWTENLPARYKAVLEQYTGVTWYTQWAPVNSKTWTEGNLVLTRLPVVSRSSFQMHATSDWENQYSNRSAAQMRVRVSGIDVDVISTHLDYYNTTHRTAQLIDLMDWAERFSTRRIVGGDFNSLPTEYWAYTMMSDYYDTWHDVTGSSSGGATLSSWRLDYLFRSKLGASKVRPTSARVLSTTLSDHQPFVADYVVSW
jgi:endonuclease/exonuclease/phosphatase family metal-dependent hydrolase